MIYVPRDGQDVLQGDIYAAVPFFHISLEQPIFFRENDPAESVARTWHEIRAEQADGALGAFVAIEIRPAMVISQDCDAARDDAEILLAAVDDFGAVYGAVRNVTSPEKIQNHITKLSKVSLKWFYLPVDQSLALFATKRAADFQFTTRLRVHDVRELERVCGLNPYAREHLRHRVAYFFQRYPVDDWYALDTAELDAYRKQNADVQPYPWQRKMDEEPG